MVSLIVDNSSEITFEDFKHKNGITYRLASEFMHMLGYESIKVFEKVINKAIKTLTTLGIDVFDNIIKVEKDGTPDYKLTRYACYIIAMNGDTKLPGVAASQSYFAEQTRRFEILQEDADRLSIRSELTEGNKSLSSTVYMRGVSDYARFNQAGYIGLYGMENYKLATKRKINKEKIFDSMGRTELAANLFRVTQTEEKIKSGNIRGQMNLEKAHKDVGKEVREMVIKNTGTNPENLEQRAPLPEVKKGLKKAQKELNKKDQT